MARLILLPFLFGALAFAVAGGVAAFRALSSPAPQRLPAASEDRMPPAIRTTAFVVLFLLLAGLTSGWLGPA